MASVLAQFISSDLQTLLPFRALTRPGGAEAADSICLDTGGLQGPITSWTLLRRFKDPVSFLSNFLLYASNMVVALSSEAFGVKLNGNCAPGTFTGCFMSLSLNVRPSRVVEVLLVLMLLANILLIYLLRRWVSGVAAPPTSLAALSALLQADTTTTLFRKIEPRSKKQPRRMCKLDRELEDHVFSLRYFRSVEGRLRYGITTEANTNESRYLDSRPSNETSQLLTSSDPQTSKAQRSENVTLGYFGSLSRTDHAIRISFLSTMCGTIILLVYYKSTRLQTPFERFMDNQSFGVRLLFTSLGLIISFFWQYQFSCRYNISTTSILKNISIDPSLQGFPPWNHTDGCLEGHSPRWSQYWYRHLPILLPESCTRSCDETRSRDSRHLLLYYPKSLRFFFPTFLLTRRKLGHYTLLVPGPPPLS